MKIGIIGLGKLGLPIALSVARHHDVVGYDVSDVPKEILRTRKYPHQEIKAQEYLEETTLRIANSVGHIVSHADILFILVQTPHHPDYEGVTRLPSTRVDFDYTYLKTSISEIVQAARRFNKRVIVTVMSTVLPSTMAHEIKPLLDEHLTPLVYNPAFPAMGTAIEDYENPEFVLLGVDDPDAADCVREFYQSFIKAPIVEMSVVSAEATKVFYNSFITAKIGLANAWMEICHRLGANVDDVSHALSIATERVVSSRYMHGGGGDSGGCHPRDNIALSWLSQNLGMCYDIFGDLMRIREVQTGWLASLCLEQTKAGPMPIVVLGKAYKADINLTVGSYATLLVNILREQSDISVEHWDPRIDPPLTFEKPFVFVIATNHADFYTEAFITLLPVGSTVIDPWGLMPDSDGVKVVRVGRSSS